MDEQTQVTLPHRFRETEFRRYERDIARIVSMFPEVVLFDDRQQHQLSPVTFSCRLRDAMTSLKKNCWRSEIVDFGLFLKVCDKISVAEQQNGSVLAGSRQALKTYTLLDIKTSAKEIVEPTERIEVLVTTIQEKTLLCELAAKRAFRRPINIFGMSVDDVEYFNKNFDVHIELDKDNSHKLL